MLWLHHAEGLSFSTISERHGGESKTDSRDLGARAAVGEAVNGRKLDLKPSMMKDSIARETMLQRDPGS